MRRGLGRRGLAALIVGLQAAALSLEMVVQEAGRSHGAFTDSNLALDALGAVSELTFAVVGFVIIGRQPRNTIGWLFLIVNLGWVITNAATAWVESSILVAPLPETPAAAWLAAWPGTISTAVYVLIALLFPDGEALTPRWGRFAHAVVVFGVAGSLMAAFGAGEVQSIAIGGVAIDNPLALPGQLGVALGGLGTGPMQLGLIVMFALAAASLVLRFRRSEAVKRVQVKWLASAIALTAAIWLSTLPIHFTYDDLSTAPQWARLWNMIAINSTMVIPVAAGIAVLRYHLWDIDRIISRTIGWGLVSGLVGATFAIAVVTLDSLLADVTSGQTLAVAASTLAAVALFLPLRRRVQAAVDRRFDRVRYDGQRAVDSFAGRLRDEVDLFSIRQAALATVETTVRPAHAGLWLRRDVQP